MAEVPRISRRTFVAASATAMVAGAVPFPAAASPRTLRIAAGEADGPKGTLDPAFSTDDPDAARISLVYERLVIRDDTFAAQPQLAESWAHNGMADTWTFKLRSEFWDNVWLKKPFITSSWSGRDTDAALSVPYLSDAKWNETHWRWPEFDKLIITARQTVDEAERAELYKKA